MVAKKIVTGLFCSSIVLGLCFYGIAEKQLKNIEEQKSVSSVPQKQNINKPATTKKYDLYSETPYDLPFLSIYEISKLPETTKKIIDELLEASQGFYLLKKIEDKIIILFQNPVVESNTYSRHDLQYVEIYPDGKKIFHNAGFVGINDEIYNISKTSKDSWVYDKSTDSLRPTKHIVKDERGKVKYTELWNYSEKEPIKYQMKNSQGKVISILKETLENDSNYRKEHIFYDNDGNITMSITINYDGANISRFTYFNTHNSLESISILSEYTDGVKTKEFIYDENYNLTKTIVSNYVDGIRKELQILNPEGTILEKLSS